MKPPKVELASSEPLQDYYSDVNGDLYSVARLIDACKYLKPFDAPIAALDLSGACWSGENHIGLAWHCKKVNAADLSKPIIIGWDGCIADGRHRVIKAVMLGKRTVKAVRMTWKPEPCKKAE